MTWHNAFVFRPDGLVDVYEVYKMDTYAHTERPVMTLIGEDPRDLACVLSQLILDLGKGRYFESIQKMQQHYGMGGDDLE